MASESGPALNRGPDLLRVRSERAEDLAPATVSDMSDREQQVFGLDIALPEHHRLIERVLQHRLRRHRPGQEPLARTPRPGTPPLPHQLPHSPSPDSEIREHCANGSALLGDECDHRENPGIGKRTR